MTRLILENVNERFLPAFKELAKAANASFSVESLGAKVLKSSTKALNLKTKALKTSAKETNLTSKKLKTSEKTLIEGEKKQKTQKAAKSKKTKKEPEFYDIHSTPLAKEIEAWAAAHPEEHAQNVLEVKREMGLL